MNQLLTRWADISAMVLSVVLAIGYTVKMNNSAPGTYRPLALFFFIFGPMAVGVHMAAHQVFINYVAFLRILNGGFVYDFRFYSLNLMGILLAVLGFKLLGHCIAYFKGAATQRKKWLYACGWIVLVAAPTIPFTFIGTLPVQAIVIHLVASFFVRKKVNVAVLKMHPPAVRSAGSKALSVAE